MQKCAQITSISLDNFLQAMYEFYMQLIIQMKRESVAASRNPCLMSPTVVTLTKGGHSSVFYSGQLVLPDFGTL